MTKKNKLGFSLTKREAKTYLLKERGPLFEGDPAVWRCLFGRVGSEPLISIYLDTKQALGFFVSPTGYFELYPNAEGDTSRYPNTSTGIRAMKEELFELCKLS